MIQRTNSPTPRLRQFPIGTSVKLTGVDRTLTVSSLRDDGYIELTNAAGYLSVTASGGHPVEEMK